MSERYEIKLGELRGSPPEHLGYFALTFTVQPPIDFASEQARLELGTHTLNTINSLQDDGFSFDETNSRVQSEHARVSFTHNTRDNSATVGNISGFANEARVTKATILSALEIVINGDGKRS